MSRKKRPNEAKKPAPASEPNQPPEASSGYWHITSWDPLRVLLADGDAGTDLLCRFHPDIFGSVKRMEAVRLEARETDGRVHWKDVLKGNETVPAEAWEVIWVLGLIELLDSVLEHFPGVTTEPPLDERSMNSQLGNPHPPVRVYVTRRKSTATIKAISEYLEEVAGRLETYWESAKQEWARQGGDT